jgi:hypothetical protein
MAGTRRAVRSRHTGSPVAAVGGLVALIVAMLAAITSLSASPAEAQVAGTWTWNATGNMTTPRFLAAPTLLPDGDVLMAGGSGPTSALASTEL